MASLTTTCSNPSLPSLLSGAGSLGDDIEMSALFGDVDMFGLLSSDVPSCSAPVSSDHLSLLDLPEPSPLSSMLANDGVETFVGQASAPAMDFTASQPEQICSDFRSIQPPTTASTSTAFGYCPSASPTPSKFGNALPAPVVSPSPSVSGDDCEGMYLQKVRQQQQPSKIQQHQWPATLAYTAFPQQQEPQQLQTPPAMVSSLSSVSPRKRQYSDVSSLASKGDELSVSGPNVSRRERNREHAKKTRTRRKNFTMDLENACAALKAENAKLKALVMSKIEPNEATKMIRSRIVTPDEKLVKILQTNPRSRVMANSSLTFLRSLREDTDFVRGHAKQLAENQARQQKQQQLLQIRALSQSIFDNNTNLNYDRC